MDFYRDDLREEQLKRDKIRLKEMLKATVDVKSEVGVGTSVLIKIPKNDETRLEEC